MVVVMEMGSGKLFDETCSVYGEEYGNEVLYAGWAEAPRLAERSEQALTVKQRQASGAGLEGFLARLYTAQE